MVAAAILAGGRGRRMGGAVKPFLRVDGRRIIDRQLEVLRPLFDAIAIVVVDRAPFEQADLRVGEYGGVVEIVTDRQGPGWGPLAGLDAALAWLPDRFDALICVAGDMPFLSPSLIEYLRDVAPADAPAVVPIVADRLQPLCARYHRALAPTVASLLENGTRALHALVDNIASANISNGPLTINERSLRALDPTLATFANINRPDDLRGA